MAVLRFSYTRRSRHSTHQEGARVVEYLTRTGVYTPDTAYLTRTTKETKHRDDLRHSEVGNLPKWAQGDASTFFEASYCLERVNGSYATVVQLSLPRELSHEQHLELARDFLRAHLHDKPHLWVKHEPQARDGEAQPHIHILCSTRMMPNAAQGPEGFFRRPEVGGARKDPFWWSRSAPERLRASWADLTNFHLERAGYDARVDPRTLYRQGIARKPQRKGVDEVCVRNADEENTIASTAWEARKQCLGIADVHAVSRAEMVDVTRRVARTRLPGSMSHHITMTTGKDLRLELEQRTAHTQARITQLQRAQRGELRAHELLAVVQGEARVQQGLTAHLDQHEEWGQSYGR